jgi:hypothetical protein
VVERCATEVAMVPDDSYMASDLRALGALMARSERSAPREPWRLGPGRSAGSERRFRSPLHFDGVTAWRTQLDDSLGRVASG